MSTVIDILKMKRLFLLLFLACCGVGLLAQNNLKAAYKNSASVPDFLNVCGDPDRVVVTISTDGLSGQTRSAIQATLNLFQGVSFVKLDTLSTTFGVTLSSTANPSKPRFNLPNLSPTGLNQVDIAFYIAADCGYTDTLAANNAASVFDVWNFTYNLGTVTGLTESDATAEYRTAFKVPVLTMANVQTSTPPNRVGDCFTRSLRLANSALQGFVDTVFYSNLQGAGVSISAIHVNGLAIPLKKTLVGTDTLVEIVIDSNYIKLATIGSNPGDGDIFLDPDESLLIEENICVVSCTRSRVSLHKGAWGCKGERCNDTEVSGFARIGNGAPNALLTAPINDPVNEVVGYCKPGVLRVQYRNNGSEIDPGFATMKDVEVRIGMTNALQLDNDFFTVTGIRLAGVDLNVLDNTIELDGHPQFFQNDPDGAGGLSDADGDGYFDDLTTGSTFDVIVYYELSCDSLNRAGMDSLFLNEFNIAWTSHLVYTDACAGRITKSLPSFGAMQSSNEEVLNCIDADAYPNLPFEVQHIETRGVRNFTKNCGGAERFVVWTAPPPGVTIDPSTVQIFKNNSTIPTPQTNFYYSVDTLFVEFDASNPFLNGKYDVRLEYVPDCFVGNGRIPIPFGFQHYCPGCDCRHTWYSSILEGPQFHPIVPPCPAGITCPQGMQAVGFDVQRTTFGFTDATYTTPMNPSQANRNVAIHCDSVEMALRSIVGGMALTDSIGIVISYDNVEGLVDTNEIFLFGSAYVRIHSGGQVYSCAIDTNDLSVIREDTTKTLFFDLSSCIMDLGLTLQPGDSVNFFGSFMLNPDGPMIDNFRKVPNFRAYSYATIDGGQYACDNYGKNFFVSKIPTVFATPGGNNFPRGCSNSPFSYRLITKNIGFSDLYGNEHYPAISVDSFVLHYDTLFLNAFSDVKVEVSIPGHPIHGNDFYEIPPLMPSDSGVYVARFDTLMEVPAYNIVQSYSWNLRISVSPGCESLTGSANMNANYKFDPTLYYTDRYFANFFGDGSCADDRAETRPQNLTYADPPTISFEPITNPNHLLTGDTARWTVKQCNTSTKADANGTWIAASYDTSEMRIVGIEVIDDPNNPIDVPFFTYDNGKIFAFTPGVLRQAANNTANDICNTLLIKAVPIQCGTYPLDMQMGYNCSTFDTMTWTPDDYLCDVEEIALTLTTVDPSVDATVVNQPATFPSLCDTVSMELLVRNTGQGTMFEVLSQFSIPLEGATLLPEATEFAYPSDAPFQPVLGVPTFAFSSPKGKFYKYTGFDSLNTTLAQNGLLGFDPLNPSTTNEFKIKYKFVTDCDFKGGVLNFYSFNGFKVCGDPSNLETGESLPINFAGLLPPADKLFDVAFGASSLLANGDTSTLQIMAINKTSTATDTLDKLSIKLPVGVEYVPNTSVAVQPSWAIQEPTITTEDSIKILTWCLPDGILMGDTAIIDFKVVSPTVQCSGALESALSTNRTLDYFCPSGALACQTAVITTDGGEQFFTISVGQNQNFAGADVSICPNGSVQLDATQSPNAGAFTLFEWMPVTGLSDPQSAMPTANPGQTTTYMVLATDTSGCVYLDEITVTVANNLALSSTITDASCGVDNGSVSFSVQNGSGNYVWTWSPSVSDSASAVNLGAGLYEVTLTDTQSGCAATDNVSVTQNGVGVAVNLTAFPASSINPDGGSIAVDITMGQTPYAIQWDGPVIGDIANLTQNNFTITGLSQGNYSVTVTDADGCSTVETATVTLDVINNLALSATPVADTSCCIDLGKINLTATGGDGNYTFVWSPMLGMGSDLGNGQFSIDSVAPGLYEITVTDGFGSTTSTQVTVLDACMCQDIFPDDVIYEPSGVEAICIPIPYVFIQNYPIIINNQPYPGPFAPCDFDTIVAYSFSFVTGFGLDGPYKLNSWQCNNVTITDVTFNDIFDLADSMNVWDPFGFWYADPVDLVIYGGDYDQSVYGSMDIMYVPTWTPFDIAVNYTEFAYGTFVFVNPFDGKVVVEVTDTSTCCTDSVCVIFINPCEDLIPNEPFVAYTDDPTVCVPIPFDSMQNFFIFVDGFAPGLTTSCDNGNGTAFEVTGGLGFYEFIAIDTSRWCADTVDLHIIDRPIADRLTFTTLENTLLSDICMPTNELLGDTATVSICRPPFNGQIIIDGDSCISYMPDPNFVGLDSCCVMLCDEFGVCDTAYLSLRVSPLIIPDTLNVTTPYETPIDNICADLSQLAGINIQFAFCDQPNNGQVVRMVGSYCSEYTPNAGFVGIDQYCMEVCDDLGFCDTTIVNVLVEPPVISPGFMTDTLYLTTLRNVPIMNVCMDLSEIGTFASLGWCAHTSGATGVFDNGLALTTQNCFSYFPSNGFTGLDSACVYVCNAQGECDTTFIYVLVEDMPNGPYFPNNDTLYLATPMNTRIMGVCQDPSELQGNLVSNTVCGAAQNGIFQTLPNSTCITYMPAPNYEGFDQACAVICDDAGICDTTIFIILVTGGDTIPDPVPTPDTLNLTTQMNVPISSICMDESELFGGAVSLSFCSDTTVLNGTVQSNILPCIDYTPDMGFVGNDALCVEICDAFGTCDTTYIFITVEMVTPPAPTPDSLYLTTLENTPIPNICLDQSQLSGAATSISLCGNPFNGSATLVAAPCLEYAPDANYVGQDQFCAFICDASGVCDTTYIFVTVEDDTTNNNTPPTPDTLYLTTPLNTAILGVCLDENELTTASETIALCGNPSNGTVQLNTAPCFDYTPNTGFIGMDNFCAVICDSTGLCDTTFVVVTVEDTTTMNPILTIDSLYFTTPMNQGITGICVNMNEVAFANSINLCAPPQNGTVTLDQVPCLDYAPAVGFVGLEEFCVVICDSTGLCDTSYVFISVEMPVNTPDAIYVMTEKNTTSAQFCVDTTDLAGTIVNVDFCGLPNHGLIQLQSFDCMVFTPAQDYVGLDTACVYICDDLGECDTTFIYITVTDTSTMNPTISPDTLYISTEMNLPSMEFCLDTTELPGNVTAFDFCEMPNHGTLQLNTISCLQYYPNQDYVGLDTACVFLCDDEGNCDTTYLFFLIKTPDLGAPDIDTLYLATKVDSTIFNVCVDTTELLGNIVSIASCMDASNGTLIFNQPYCFDYQPNAGFVGMDSACVVICDDTGACDSTLVFIMVTPLDTTMNPTGNAIDTIYITTDYETLSDTFCIASQNGIGAIASTDFCSLPDSGSVAVIGDSCFTYLPSAGFIGNDTACVVFCDADGLCDTTIVVFTVNAPNNDCGFFALDSLVIEVFPSDPFGRLCVSLPLDQVPAYTFLDNGQPYSNGFRGCDFDTCFAYTYFTFPDFGAMGPYRLDYWVVDGDTLTTTFSNVNDLVAQMNAFDPTGNWLVNANTLTIETCTAPARDYGNMRVTQISSAGIGLAELNVNLKPNGVELNFTPGEHFVTVEGLGCTDSIWIAVMPASVVSADTFIYVGMGADTLCLGDYGIDFSGATNVEFTCPDENGDHVTFAYDAATGCISYEGIAVGRDRFCIKFSFGMDSCLYFHFTVDAIETVPCSNFIPEDILTVEADDCNDPEVMLCFNIPFAIASEFEIFVDGLGVVPMACPPDPTGAQNLGILMTETGVFQVIVSRFDFACVDTVTAVVTCADDSLNIVYDTIYYNETAQFCVDTTGMMGFTNTFENVCPLQSGSFVQFVTNDDSYCVDYAGLTANGTETACLVICDDMGFCDTTLLVVTVIDSNTTEPTTPPIAFDDRDTILMVGMDANIFILDNDTLNMAGTPTVIVPPNHGVATILPDNSLLYVPSNNYCSDTPDSLQYLLCNTVGCDTAWVYILVPCQDLVIYTGFSPNGDDMNETFWMDGLQRYDDNMLRIYNRWGNMVYQAENYTGNWDGTWDGSPLPDGTYFFIFYYGEGRSQRAEGYVQIRR